MRLLSELRRRNVLRMAVLYTVAAWLVMQVAEVITSLVSLPDWLGPTLIALLAIGFPIALVFSWLFEITPEGLSLEKDVPDGQSITYATGRRMDFVIIAILSAGLILFAWDKWWPRGPEELSIAVLPFENMSADPEQEYFSDGISEEVLNLLAQIPPLKVIARTSSFSFKDKAVDIATMSQQLGVRYILEGSVRRSGNRVRITAQFIDAKDSSHLWSQTYDRDLNAANLFYVQSDIARAITNRMHMTLTGDDEQRLANVPTENTEAYTAYLLGRHRLTDRKIDDLADAVEQFARAIELDPRFAGAYSGLVDACSLYEYYSKGYSNENCPPSAAEREQLARKAIELDPESGEAWVSLGQAIREQVDYSAESMPKLREAISAFEHGLELNPNMSQGYHWYGLALQNFRFLYPNPPWGWFEAVRAGDFELAFDRGLEVDPLSVPLHYMKASYPWVTRSKEEAIWHAHRMIEIAPDSPRGYETLGEQAWNLEGRLDESIRWESKALERDPKSATFPMSMGRAYSALGDSDMALAYFDLAKVLTAHDDQPAQQRLLVEQAIIRLVSGNKDAPRVAELQPLASKLADLWYLWNIRLGVLVDLTMGQPADALARVEAATPKCFSTGELRKKVENQDCPIELVRVYQELGDQSAARELIDVLVPGCNRVTKLFPLQNVAVDCAGALAISGRTGEALDVLENLVSSNWRGKFQDFLRFTLYFDLKFDAIRDDERFQTLLATIEADMAQQLENVREMQRRGEIPTFEELKARIASI